MFVSLMLMRRKHAVQETHNTGCDTWQDTVPCASFQSRNYGRLEDGYSPSPPCFLRLCVYLYVHVHAWNPLNFSPLPGRITAVLLYSFTHLA